MLAFIIHKVHGSVIPLPLHPCGLDSLGLYVESVPAGLPQLIFLGRSERHQKIFDDAQRHHRASMSFHYFIIINVNQASFIFGNQYGDQYEQDC